MPELPEIAAHAERLNARFTGAELARFAPLHMTALKTFAPPPEAAVGRALTCVCHRGKFLCLLFGPAADRIAFVVHLMQGGRLRPDLRQAAKPRGGMARWAFSDGRALLLTEAGTERRAGVWITAGDPDACPPVARLGPDADRISRAELARRLASSGGRVHGFLRNQANLAGIGRLLANEILHAARISPFANTARLDDPAVDRLHAAIADTVARGLAADRELDEMGPSAGRPSDVHHRVGLPCRRACGDEVRAVEYRRYRVAYCPACQTGGRVLADNTTSRFLR